MDSSKAIQLGVKLEKKLKQKLPTGIALHLTDVASLLSFAKSSEMGHVVTFDSRKEAQEDLVSFISAIKSFGRQQKQIQKGQDHIFLTGVTGFLGSAILASLLLSTRSKITCLVRKSCEDDSGRLCEAMKWFPPFINYQNRIQVCYGDITKEHLGLEEQYYHYLCDTVDTIIHSAAVVNWILPYSKLRSANVHGTTRIIQFAQTKRTKILLHISSTSSDIEKDGGNQHPETITSSVQDGYGLSKYVSEELVWECSRSGVPVIVVSPGMIGPHRIYNHLNESQFYERYVRSVVSCGCVPKTSPWHVIEFTPVDYVSSIVTLLLMSAPKAVGKRFEIPTCSFGLSYLHEQITKKGYILNQVEDFQKWKELMKSSELSPLLEIIDMSFFQCSSKAGDLHKLSMVLCGASTRDSYPTISPPSITEADVMWWLRCMEERKLFGK